MDRWIGIYTQIDKGYTHWLTYRYTDTWIVGFLGGFRWIVWQTEHMACWWWEVFDVIQSAGAETWIMQWWSCWSSLWCHADISWKWAVSHWSRSQHQGDKALNVFYVTDAAGNPVNAKTIEAVRSEIGQTILQVKESSIYSKSPPEETGGKFSLGNLFRSSSERFLHNLGFIKSPS